MVVGAREMAVTVGCAGQAGICAEIQQAGFDRTLSVSWEKVVKGNSCAFGLNSL